MKTLIFLITIIAATSLVRAGENEEIIWETEKIGGINDVLVSPLGDVFYNVTGSTIQIRSIEDGTLIDFFIPEYMPNHITHISITDDGRYMAMSGDNPHIVIYDLLEQKEVKRFTTNVFEREENGTHTKYKTKRWLSSSISPDGTKVTGIAEGDQATYSTCWIVIDIVSGKELVKESRLGYDYLNPENSSNFWITSEYTPDGNYIVSQLDWGGGGQSGPDSIYIHNANTFEVYDVVLNEYWESRMQIKLNPNSESFIYHGNSNSNLYKIYNFRSKSIIKEILNLDIWTFTFLRKSDYAIYGYDWNLQIYDYDKDKIIYEYETLVEGIKTTLDDNVLIASLYGVIYGLNTNFSETSLEAEYEEKIVINPNPTNSFVNINLECLEPIINYSVYNTDSVLLNQSVIENQNGSFTLDFSTYPTGVYFLTLRCNNKMKVYKIIKEG